MSDILTRRETRFVVWCPATAASSIRLGSQGVSSRARRQRV